MDKKYTVVFDRESAEYAIYSNSIQVFTVRFDGELNQVIISTPNEVYAGPIDLISFADIKEKLDK